MLQKRIKIKEARNKYKAEIQEKNLKRRKILIF